MNVFSTLSEQWQAEAALLRRYGDEQGATVCELHSRELEAACDAWQNQELTTAEAGEECGYSEEQLRRKVRAGELPAVRNGARGRYRLRRGDLPRKKASRRRQADARTASDSYNVDEDARSIAERTRGA